MTPVLLQGDCLDAMWLIPDGSVDAIVTDPPYGLSFMGKKWDYDVPSIEIWAQCLRVLKPGGHLLAFAGTRTQHRMAVRIEDAGFEIRDMIAWVYGSGFPKSLDVSKAIDRQRTEDRAPVDAVRSWLNARRLEAGFSHDAVNKHFGHASNGGGSSSAWMTNPTSRALPTWEQWQQLKAMFGFGDEMDAEVWRLNGRKGQPGEAWQTAEVVAVEVRMNEASGIVSAGRDERVEVERQIKAANSDAARRWKGWGTALKPALEPITVARKPLVGTVAANVMGHGTGALNIDGCRVGTETITQHGRGDSENIAMSGRNYAEPAGRAWEGRWPANLIHDGEGAADLLGDAARFFYCAKASKKDRGDGNAHPTVKPTDLMRYLCRLVTPPGGVVLDPFMGSGSTGKAAVREGFNFIGIERDPEYFKIAKERIG